VALKKKLIRLISL